MKCGRLALAGAILALVGGSLSIDSSSSAAGPRAAPVSVIVWAGGRTPSDLLNGVEIRGRKARTLRVSRRNRRRRKVTVLRRFRISSGRSRAIRAAALSALSERRVTVDRVRGGVYVSAFIRLGR